MANNRCWKCGQPTKRKACRYTRQGFTIVRQEERICLHCGAKNESFTRWPQDLWSDTRDLGLRLTDEVLFGRDNRWVNFLTLLLFALLGVIVMVLLGNVSAATLREMLVGVSEIETSLAATLLVCLTLTANQARNAEDKLLELRPEFEQIMHGTDRNPGLNEAISEALDYIRRPAPAVQLAQSDIARIFDGLLGLERNVLPETPAGPVRASSLRASVEAYFDQPTRGQTFTCASYRRRAYHPLQRSAFGFFSLAGEVFFRLPIPWQALPGAFRLRAAVDSYWKRTGLETLLGRVRLYQRISGSGFKLMLATTILNAVGAYVGYGAIDDQCAPEVTVLVTLSVLVMVATACGACFAVFRIMDNRYL